MILKITRNERLGFGGFSLLKKITPLKVVCGEYITKIFLRKNIYMESAQNFISRAVRPLALAMGI